MTTTPPDREERPYGLWPSPLTPQRMASSQRLNDVAWDSDGQTLVWLETRGGKGVLVAQQGNDAPRDLTTDLAVRARVGYGGGDFAVSHGNVYFAEATSGRLYRQPLTAGVAAPLTPAYGHAASPTVAPSGRWVLYVSSYEEVDRLALVDAAGEQWPQIVASGADFYMQPTWSPDESRVAWVQWNHPQMPWDGSTLYIAEVVPPATPGGLPTLSNARPLVGDEHTAINQPKFAPDGRSLVYLSDQTGWDNLYRYDLTTDTTQQLTTGESDFGQPAWVQGLRAFAFYDDGNALLLLQNNGGFRRCWRHDLRTNETTELSLLTDYTWLEQPAVASGTQHLALIASSATTPARVVTVDLASAGQPARIRARSSDEGLPAGSLATPHPVSWATDNGSAVHGLYYPPTNSQYLSEGLPPAIVRVHGGPTSATTSTFNSAAQFFTSRGYAVLEVNHRGSTGYGRDYRNALRETWGVVDIADTATGADYLTSAGLADGKRLVVMGGSAGGYTVLQMLVTHPGLFKAALCLYGIANLFTLATDTHKFELRYLDSLIGPLPETSDRYRARSPIYQATKISDPVAIFQGAEDPVVPPAQAELIVAALRRQGIPHEYHLYPGEGHGWRKPETIATFWAAVERFLQEYVLFG